MSYLHYYFFFFFQAEDGIRGFHVTGVQTCALPIYIKGEKGKYQLVVSEKAWKSLKMRVKTITAKTKPMSFDERSEERRVGKECRSGGALCHCMINMNIYIYS